MTNDEKLKECKKMVDELKIGTKKVNKKIEELEREIQKILDELERIG